MINILEKNKLFKGLTSNEIDHILSCHEPMVKTFEAHEHVFMKGEELEHFGVVLSGRLHLLKDDFYGNESIVQKVYPSDSFGEAIALIEKEPTPVRVLAAVKSTVVFFNMRRFITQCERACDHHRRLKENLLQQFAVKLLSLHEKIELLSKKTIRDKLLDYFNRQRERQHSKTIELPFSRQELADYLNADRSAMVREMKKMREDGIIRVRGNTIDILK